jgi:glutaredoxin
MSYKEKYFKYKSKYLELKQKQLSKQTGGNNTKPTIILYKADWCGHCNKFKEVWKRMDKNKYDLITYDSEKDSQLIKDNEIQGFPTIIIVKNGIKTEYNGNRTEKDINNFISKL